MQVCKMPLVRQRQPLFISSFQDVLCVCEVCLIENAYFHLSSIPGFSSVSVFSSTWVWVFDPRNWVLLMWILHWSLHIDFARFSELFYFRVEYYLPNLQGIQRLKFSCDVIMEVWIRWKSRDKITKRGVRHHLIFFSLLYLFYLIVAPHR